MIREKLHIEIPSDIMKIQFLFKDAGHKLFVVGGAVRDALLEKKPKDFDLATDAEPDKVEKILSSYRTLGTGKAFGVINVFTETGEFEIATFRKDLSGGRRPDAVEFTTIEEDVKRRDLTLNALFYDLDTMEIVDLVGGIHDIKNGIIRTVGVPAERFSEDRLRILRAIRFAARFGTDLSNETAEAIKTDNNLFGVSKERIRDEFIKGVSSAKSVIFFMELLKKYNLFEQVFEGFHIKEDFLECRNKEIAISHLLASESRDNINKNLDFLKYTRDEIEKVLFFNQFRDISLDSAFKLKKLQVRLADSNAKLLESEIIEFASFNNLDDTLVKSFLTYRLSIVGEEVMSEGFKGANIGKEIERREKLKFLEILEKI